MHRYTYTHIANAMLTLQKLWKTATRKAVGNWNRSFRFWVNGDCPNVVVSVFLQLCHHQWCRCEQHQGQPLPRIFNDEAPSCSPIRSLRSNKTDEHSATQFAKYLQVIPSKIVQIWGLLWTRPNWLSKSDFGIGAWLLSTPGDVLFPTQVSQIWPLLPQPWLSRDRNVLICLNSPHHFRQIRP